MGKERFVVNAKGRRIGVLLGVREYRRMLADLEELECIRAYDVAKASGEEPVPFDGDVPVLGQGYTETSEN